MISLNCSDVSSFDKLFTWTFAKPAADALSMLNDGGSATGVSAQIRVNTDLTNADGSTNSSRIINSGLTYEGLLKGSVAITPIYSVGFIRNGEAVSLGSFSSNATLSVNYR
jgi:type 1 fimbria pilin